MGEASCTLVLEERLTNMNTKLSLVLLAAAGLSVASACDVRVNLESGPICGLVDELPGLPKFARFLNVPYAQQPLGALRFKELQPVEPWTDDYDATVQGPMCPQKDELYGPLLPQTQGMSEACIHANIFAPISALPAEGQTSGAGLPIFVHVHGGAFQAGSGDTSIAGPEYFYDDNVIIITFNYRLHLFGFMSLNTASMPGNNALRDMITLLKWVQANAARLGGDPDNVTLSGHSSGGVCAHLLTLSPAAQGLFKRAFLISGTGINDLYTTNPAYAQYVTDTLLANLGITATDPEEIYKILVDMPIETLMEGYSITQDQTGQSSFVPVVESEFEGVTRILDGDPEYLVKIGRGKDIPLILGFDTAEAYTMQGRISKSGAVEALSMTSLVLVPARFTYSLPENQLIEIGDKMKAQYIHGTPTLNQFLDFISDCFFVYPSIKLAYLRAESGAADTYLYQFSYEGEFKILQQALNVSYPGVGHFEEVTYMMRMGSVLNDMPDLQTPTDDRMRTWMTSILHNYTLCSKPICDAAIASEWPPVQIGELKYQDFRAPEVYSIQGLTDKQKTMFEFFQSIDKDYPTPTSF